MHYYQFNIGDYHSHTSHLDPIEDIAYRRMIDFCYLNEMPLPKEIDEIARLIRMRSHNESIANVLRDFFKLTKNGYIQQRIVNEIEKFKLKSEKAKKSAQARWGSNTKVIADANALRTESEGNANHKPITNNHKPINNTCQESKIPPCPHEKIIDLYHEILPELQSVNKTLWKGSDREKNLTSRWRQHEEFRKSQFWRWYFESLRKSMFHMGENDRGWKADLGWLVKKTNFVKLVEKFND